MNKNFLKENFNSSPSTHNLRSRRVHINTSACASISSSSINASANASVSNSSNQGEITSMSSSSGYASANVSVSHSNNIVDNFYSASASASASVEGINSFTEAYCSASYDPDLRHEANSSISSNEDADDEQNEWYHEDEFFDYIKDYIKDKQIRQYYKYLKALCFVPPSDVIEAFNIISKDAPTAFVPMLIHLEKYYIGESFSNRPGVRAVPAYPIKFWNCYYRVLNGDARTDILLQQLKSGDNYGQRKKNKDFDLVLKTAVSDYDKKNIFLYLDKIATILDSNK